MSDYIVDIETDGIQATRIHCLVSLCNGEFKQLTTYKDMQDFLNGLTPSDRIIGHNFQRYDKPTLERILGINIVATIVDTLALSWYAFPDKLKHGLEFWGESFGIPKPVITDWDSLSIDEYIHRCTEDVKINLRVWEAQLVVLNDLYDDKPEPLIKYLSFKMRMAELQEDSKWALDIEKANDLLLELETIHNHSSDKLSKIMPMVDRKAKRNPPKLPFKQDKTLSASGAKWFDLCKEHGFPSTHKETIEVVVGQVEPNPNSNDQIKDWLFSLGWKPATVRCDSGRNIPQIKTKKGNLCNSIKRLCTIHPDLEVLDSMAVIKHRIGLVRGLLKNEQDGFVTASIQGLTNTLRFKHRVCVNLPSARKPYGLEIRGLLTARKGMELVGSDMCSLEDRVKQHYMWEYDPEYVKEMSKPDFDPHLDLAVSAKALSEDQVAKYKGGDKCDATTKIRYNFKGGNYALQYGCGVPTLARQLGISKHEATIIFDAYWKRNWSVMEITEGLATKERLVRNKEGHLIKVLWQYNPVSELWYSLRTEKDRFSTLCQGTGTYVFDMWVAFILQQRQQLTANFHDEIVLEVKSGNQEGCIKLLEKAIHKVNSVLNLNRELEVDIQFGNNYADIH